MKIKLTATLLAIGMSAITYAQDHNHPYAAGLRASPDGVGATVRYHPSELIAIEGQLNFSGGRPSGLPSSSGKSTMAGILAQVNAPLIGPQVMMFFGVGAHYGSWIRYKDVSKNETMYGLDVVFGVEYRFSDMPLGVSVDVKPSLNYAPDVTYFPNNILGLSARYYFGNKVRMKVTPNHNNRNNTGRR
ncbi:MAG: hypothetical protein JNM41_15060 [Flavipsychrobacter sp.]|nr:hypothetical protein [Flavipsychrobacter sp.]